MALNRPVARALADLAESVHDRSLAQPIDRQRALSMFVYLIDRGEKPRPDDVRRWATAAGWSEEGARDLGRMADDVRWLIDRLNRRQGWGHPDAWFAEA